MLTDTQPLPHGPPALPGIVGSLLARRALLWFIPVKQADKKEVSTFLV